MKILKIFFATLSFMAISLTAYALPMTATLSVKGFAQYDASGDGTGSELDALFFDNDWTYSGSFSFATSVMGTPPAFSQNAYWYLSGEGGFEYGWEDVQANTGSGGDGGAFGPISLGYGSADDLFGPAISGYGDILPALGAALSGTPTLTDVVLALNAILDPSLMAGLPLPTSITGISDNIYFTLLGPNTVAFVSDLGLTIGSTGLAADSAYVTFGGNLTLRAIPEPGMLGLLGLGLIGLAMIRRKRLAA